MIRAQFRIQLPADLWITQLSEEYPRATFRLLSGFRMEEKAVELREIVTDSVSNIVEAMREQSSVSQFELLESSERRVLVKYESSKTALYEFVEDLSLTVEFPLLVQNGWYEFDLTGTRDELNQLREALDSGGFDYELRSIVTTTEVDSIMTERQQELLETAARKGYFEVPRQSTLGEVAESIGIDKSTASTVLRRGEAKLVNWFLSTPDRAGHHLT
jgi:predicted DNA binding protein